MVVDTVYLINEAIEGRKNVLVEGANAVMLDYDLGVCVCVVHVVCVLLCGGTLVNCSVVCLVL